MKFTSIFTTAILAANVIASPLAAPEAHQLSKRDAPAVVSAVKTLSDDMVALNQTLNTYEGGLGSALTALKIKSQTDTVKKATEAVTEAVTEAADASAKFNNKGAGEVANSLLALQPNINSVLDNLVSKKGAFEQALLGFISLTWLVKSDLEDLKELSAELGEAVIKKLTPQYAALAPVLNKQIAKKFSEAIKAYE